MFLFRLIYDLLHNFQLAYREGLWDATVAGSAHKAWSLEGNSYFILTLLLDIIILLRNFGQYRLLPIYQSSYSSVFAIVVQVNVASAISTIQANKVTEDGAQGVQGLMIR
jgi:hypothetical protein